MRASYFAIKNDEGMDYIIIDSPDKPHLYNHDVAKFNYQSSP
jgi:hypothetical protein